MNESELGAILKTMYEKALEGEKVVNIHLFGIKYAPIILKDNLNVKEIIRCSGISDTYATEVSKGIKLSDYVIVK